MCLSQRRDGNKLVTFWKTAGVNITRCAGHLATRFPPALHGDSIRVWNQKMLPAVVFQNQILVALLFEAFLNFRRNVWTGIHVKFDQLILADESLKVGFPALVQNADFRKITLRHCLYE